MPLTVPCPICAATVNVRDEYAGRQVRCPRCKTVLDTTAPQPSSPPPPPPLPVARALPPLPPPAPAPIPPGVRLPSALPRTLAAADEKPAKKRRSRDDQDDGRPLRRRPKPKAKANRGPVLWIVGGVVGVLLLIGGCAGLFYGLVQPALDRVASGGGGKSDPNNPRVSEENAFKILAGMTPAEVEAILGKGRPAVEKDFLDAQNEMQDRAFTESMIFWVPMLNAGEVSAWTNGKSRFLVGFSKPPEQGGTVVGVVVVIVNGYSKWSYKFLEQRSGTGMPGNPPAAGDPPKPPPAEEPPIVVSASELLEAYLTDARLADAKYKGKAVKLTGQVKAVGTGILTLSPKMAGAATADVRAIFPPNERAALTVVQSGEWVTLTGTVMSFTQGTKAKYVVVNHCKLVN